MEARLNDTRTLDELKEQEAELQRQNEEDQAVIDNEDASPSDKQAAEGGVAERQEELARLRTQIDERERALPLRERVKEIWCEKIWCDRYSYRSCCRCHNWCCHWGYYKRFESHR